MKQCTFCHSKHELLPIGTTVYYHNGKEPEQTYLGEIKGFNETHYYVAVRKHSGIIKLHHNLVRNYRAFP